MSQHIQITLTERIVADLFWSFRDRLPARVRSPDALFDWLKARGLAQQEKELRAEMYRAVQEMQDLTKGRGPGKTHAEKLSGDILKKPLRSGDHEFGEPVYFDLIKMTDWFSELTPNHPSLTSGEFVYVDEGVAKYHLIFDESGLIITRFDLATKTPDLRRFKLAVITYADRRYMIFRNLICRQF